MSKSSLGWRLLALLLALAMLAAACGSDDSGTAAETDDTSDTTAGTTDETTAETTADTTADTAMDEGDGGDVSVSLITKDSTNPFFVAMQEGAQEKADELGINITIGSGQQEGDDQGQIDLIESAIAQGQDGILITPMSVNVNE
ncbi:MAG: substrate-binding domain-containing protein, partial [Acidimicrobiia bacterium]|nr:substrate-binding domain-containing protein [Acidimicrobiia bacterium]